MTYKNIFLSIIIVTIIASLFVTIKQPKMHKVAVIYNSDYTLVKNDIQKEEISEVIPTVNQTEQVVSVQKKIKENVEEAVNTVPKKQTVVKKDNSAIKKNTTTKAVTSTKPATVKNEVKKEPVKVVQQKPTVSVKSQEVKKEEKAKPVKVEQIEKTQPSKTVTLTKEQEEIAWNIWRSNLQNQIMKDTHLPTVPNGTVFRFKFDVDKFGRITNIQTYSDTPKYTPYAIQYMAPVIRNYQGKNILNFPVGTARVTTTVKGAWKISSSTKYSTPKDYNDIETVNR